MNWIRWEIEYKEKWDWSCPPTIPKNDNTRGESQVKKIHTWAENSDFARADFYRNYQQTPGNWRELVSIKPTHRAKVEPLEVVDESN